MKKPFLLGDFVEKAIHIVTFGYGKKFAMWVAKLRGHEDCGCDRRKDYLNKLSNPKPTPPPTPNVPLDKK